MAAMTSEVVAFGRGWPYCLSIAPSRPGAAHDHRRSIARFSKLHVAGDPLRLVNVWDAGSARAVADAGAPALATSSWAVAAAAGYPDGEELPFDALLATATAILG
ncbi:isocitrate lyase/phosphoenolpyruvate mutase family protein [Rhizorhabdus histidinilytica]